jgi:uncharacterized protein DUF2800
MLTASALLRLLNCPGSEALSKAENASPWADAGHEEHAELAQQVRTNTLPENLARLVPAGARAELALSYDVALGVGRVIGEDIGRAYGQQGAFEVFGSADVVGVEDDAAVVIDWKTGFVEVEPASTNPQLAFGALAACRALGLSRAIVRIVYTKSGVCDEAELDVIDLATFANTLSALHPRIAELKAARRRGEPVPTREGSWCRYCASKPYCPSKNALLVQLSGRGLSIVGDSTMTREKAADAVRQFQHVDQLVKEAKARLHAYVDENGPIDLGDGKAYGRYIEKGNERVDGPIAARAIADVVGESAREFSAIAVELSTSKAALTRAAKALGHQPKLATKVVARIRELGGITNDSPKRPIGEFTIGTKQVAPPLEQAEAEELDRLLESA